MNEYSPDLLSPLSIAPVECALPFGLTWEDLGAILPGFDASRAGEARAYETHRKQGVHGGENSHILRLSFPIPGGLMRDEIVFIKHNPNPDLAEAEKYRFLASRGVGVPLLMGVFDKGAGEVIVQEFLVKIGVDFASHEEVDSLLRLVADLNAIRDLPRMGAGYALMPQDEFDAGVRSALAFVAAWEDLPEVDPARWFAAFQFAREAVLSMPQAAIHLEIGFQQVGWGQRGAGREIVLFDMETLCLSTRFSDIASILYSLSAFTGRGQEELFGIYLERLAQRTGEKVDFPAAMREMRVTRIRENIEGLPWLVDEAKNPSSAVPRSALLMCVQCLKEDIEELGLK